MLKPTVMIRLPLQDHAPVRALFQEHNYQVTSFHEFKLRNSHKHPHFDKNTLLLTTTYTGEKKLVSDTRKLGLKLGLELHLFLPDHQLVASVNAKGLRNLTHNGPRGGVTQVVLRMLTDKQFNRQEITHLLNQEGIRVHSMAQYTHKQPAWTVHGEHEGIDLSRAVQIVTHETLQPILLRIPAIQLRTWIPAPAVRSKERRNNQAISASV